jgi:virginiamycin B lyase
MRRQGSIVLMQIGLGFLAGCGDHPAPVAPTIHDFTLPHRESSAGMVATGPDGNLWFTELFSNRIGHITPAGQVTEFTVPTDLNVPGYDNLWATITAGPDGNLWFTEDSSNDIWRISPAGQIIKFPLPAGSAPAGITTGPDGNL